MMGRLFFSQLNCFILQYLQLSFCLLFAFSFANTTKEENNATGHSEKRLYLCVKEQYFAIYEQNFDLGWISQIFFLNYFFR